MSRSARTLLALTLSLCLALAALPALADSAQIAKADQLYDQRADLAKAKEAAAIYRAILKADAKNAEAAWKLSRVMYFIGKRLEGEEAKMAAFTEGVEAAKAGIAADPNSIDSHYWLGVNYGLYGSAKGIMKSLSLVDPIKEEMNTVIKMNPDYDSGGPYRVLGRLYFKLPGLFGGDNDKAIANLRTAVQKGPQRWLNHVYLAEVLIDEGKDDEAKKLLELVIAGPAEPGLQPEYEEWKAEAQKLMQKL